MTDTLAHSTRATSAGTCSDYYVNMGYAGFVAALYFLTAIYFLWFGQNAANEFRCSHMPSSIVRTLINPTELIPHFHHASHLESGPAVSCCCSWSHVE